MSKTYRHPGMKQLKDQQTRYAPKDRRLEQVERAEQLLGEIEATKQYPYEYLCYRITGYRPDGWPALVLDGGDVQHDLRLFVEDLSATVRQAVEHATEPVLTVAEVGRRYNVSTRTVTRWRRQGLVARRFAHGRSHQGGFSAVESRKICHDASQPGRTRFTISAIDRRGAGRDCPPSPSDGSLPPRPGRSGRGPRGGSHAR